MQPSLVWGELQLVTESGKKWARGCFFNEFVPSVEQCLKLLNLPRKVIHFIDNAQSHSDEEKLSTSDNRVVHPPNTTSLCQPWRKHWRKNINVYFYYAHWGDR
jgi:hypothetical protein